MYSGAIAQSRHSVCKRVGWSMWFCIRSISFWSIVMAAKIVFDLCVLWPSVSGVTIHSLCVSEPDIIAFMVQRNALTMGVRGLCSQPVWSDLTRLLVCPEFRTDTI